MTVRLPMLRGTAEGADCEACPFSTCGLPTRPVFSETPQDPAFIIIGEGPGAYETRLGRPFCGPSGQVVETILGKISRPRDEVFIGNATLCQPPMGTPVEVRQQAANACKPRLMAELSMFPGKPVLTLGAVAAHAVIPREVLDAIDPPDAPKSVRKAQKMRQEPQLKFEAQRRKALKKEGERQLARLLKHQRAQLIKEHKAKHKAKPDDRYLDHELTRVQGQLEIRAKALAEQSIEAKLLAKKLRDQLKASQPKKPKKPKRIKITDIVGTLFDIDVDGTGSRPVIPALHPAALLRGGGATIGGSHTPDMAFVNLLWDAGKVNALAKGVDIRLRLNVEYELIDPGRAAELFLEAYHLALEEGEVALDLETYVDNPDRHHALMAYVARTKVIGLATRTRSISLAWEILPAWCFTLLQQLFATVTVITHNGLYDRTVLRNRYHGFILPEHGFADTLLAHHAAFPGNAHKLQVVTAQFFGIEPWKSEYRNQEENDESLAVYNAKDTGTTQALHAPLQLWVKRTKTERVYELDRKMAEAASRMHLAGMPINRDINEELREQFSKSVVEARRAVEDTARDPKLREQIWHHLALVQAGKKRKLDPDDFEARYQIRLSAMKLDPDWKWKISAGKHIAALLQAIGVGLVQTTAGGEYSTKKDVLETLVDVPIVRDILSYRENDKLLSTFVSPIFDRYDAGGNIAAYGFADEQSRIHPIWTIHKISGRWASSWPVVSNVPKDKWKKLIGDALISLGMIELPAPGKTFTLLGQLYRVNKDNRPGAPSVSRQTRPNLRRQVHARPGRKLVGFDFAQIEGRVIALISGDEHLCRIFSSGLDLHVENAKMLWPSFTSLDPDSQKQLREQGKPIGYGAMYLANVETLHKQMLKEGHNVKLPDLVKAYDRLMGAMSGVVRWQQQCVANASRPPYEVRDFILGRRRVWPMGNVESTEAVNSNVQPTAAAIMNIGMARMMPLLDAYQQADPIAQIHDACVFECWEDDAEALAKDIDTAFVQEHTFNGRTIGFPIDCRIGDSWDRV